VSDSYCAPSPPSLLDYFDLSYLQARPSANLHDPLGTPHSSYTFHLALLRSGVMVPTASSLWRLHCFQDFEMVFSQLRLVKKEASLTGLGQRCHRLCFRSRQVPSRTTLNSLRVGDWHNNLARTVFAQSIMATNANTSVISTSSTKISEGMILLPSPRMLKPWFSPLNASL